ncbi:MAG: LCP family protein [Clostridia bacterium]|nr:LCP family protein [Clostridia bacterium]
MDNNNSNATEGSIIEQPQNSIVVSVKYRRPPVSGDSEEEYSSLEELPDIELTENSSEEIQNRDEISYDSSEDAYDAFIEDSDEDSSASHSHFLYEKWNHLSTGKKVGCISCSTVFILFLALMTTLTVSFLHFYHLMDIEYSTDIVIDDSVTFSDIELSEIPDGEVTIEKNDIFRDKAVVNILLIGTDERSKNFSKNARADSVMIMSLDNNTKTIRLVSLERGMLVSIPGRKNDILTHTFRYGGANLLMETVRTHLNVDVDKYVRVNFEMFQKLVDEAGGVDVELTKKEAYGLNKWPNNNTAKLDRKVHEGINHFNGYEALQYSRLRWIDSDLERIKRQRKVLIAITENMKDLSVNDLKDVSEDCLPYIQTNLSAFEIAGILMNLPGYFEKDVEQLTIPQKGTYKTLGHVDYKKNAEILNKFLYK